ncbi:response regulator, partial [Myxococcota bacterium]|nr:response regulator [Myxococcota bacterium]
MAATVLIIDAEEEFANSLAEALRRVGVEPSVTGDGKVGLDLARINVPSAIVLCVELPRMSGYSICAKLKKDNALKGVPLVITSSEATPETFEHHKKLKTRAEEYLKKPFDPAELVDLLRGYVPIGMGSPGVGEPISEELSIEDQPPATIGDDEVFSEEEALSMHGGADPGSAEMSAIDGLLSDLSRPAGVPSARAALSQSAGVGLRGFEEEDEIMTTVGFVPPQAAQPPSQQAGFLREIGQLRAELDAMREAVAKAERDKAAAIASERAALLAASQAPSVSQVPTASAGREVVALKKELNVKDREILELREKLTSRERDLLALRDREAELEGHLVQLEEERAAIDMARMTAEERVRLVEQAMAEAHQRVGDAEARAQSADLAAQDADARAQEAEARAQDA